MACSKLTAGGVAVPVGFRFHPTEEELLDHYLRKKNKDKSFNVNNIIPVIDICKHDPWDLPARLSRQPDTLNHDMEWFCFCPRDYKYINSTRSNRTTPKGYWKITGKERVIKARRSKTVIGRKRTLTFYEGRAPNSRKTNWVMHEYYLIESEGLPNSKPAERDFVLCRLKKNSDKKDTAICAEGELGKDNVSSCEDQAVRVMTPESQDYRSSTLQSPTYIELGDVLQANGIDDDCNAMQSPFGDKNSSDTKKNDISTCDEGEPHGCTMYDYENETADDMFGEQCAQPEKNLDPTFAELEDFMHIDVSNDGCLKWQPAVGDYDFATYKNNIPTCNDNEYVSHTTSGFENQAADNMILEVCPQTGENLEVLFHAPQIEDYTLQALMNAQVGDVLHDNNYIGCNEFHSQLWS